MREPEIWEIPLPEVTLDDVFKAQGADYSKHPPRPSTEKLHRRMLEEAAGLVRPTAIWFEVDVIGVCLNLPDFKGQTHCNYCSLRTTCQLSQAG